MVKVVQILQVVFEAGAAGTIGFLVGLAFGIEHLRLREPYGTDAISSIYWPTVRRSFWLCLCLGSCYLAWFFEEGSGFIEMISAAVGVLAGDLVGLIRRRHTQSRTLLGTVVAALVLCGLDYAMELITRSLSVRLLAPFAVGGTYAAAVAVVFLFIWGVSRVIGRESRVWSFRIPAFSSLLLTSGGPFLWLVLASSVGFGYSVSSRYVSTSPKRSWSKDVLLGLFALAIGHGLLVVYFYEISSYGIFWHPVVAVTPYAIAGIIIGFTAHRVGSRVLGVSTEETPAQRCAPADADKPRR